MASKKRVLGSATLKRQHVIGGPKKPSEFLMNDRHGDVLSDTEFKSLWWHIQETMTLTNDTTRNSRMVMSIIQNCAAYRVLGQFQQRHAARHRLVCGLPRRRGRAPTAGGLFSTGSGGCEAPAQQ